MSWAIIVELIIALIPFLLKWLEEILSDDAKTMGSVPASKEIFDMKLHEYFRRAEEKIPFWKFWRKPILRRVERSIKARSGEFHQAMLTGNKSYITPLTAVETEELRQSMGV